MKKIREMLRLKFGLGTTHRDISVACGVSPSTVSDCLARCKREELSWPLPEGLTDSELEQRVYRLEPCKDEDRPVPDWSAVHSELRRRDYHVSRFELWQEYRKAHPNGYEYSWYCERYTEWAATIEPVMRKQHRGGYATFVDYAGDTVKVVDPATGEVREAQLFVGVLGASNYTFAEATWTQKLSCWVGSHVRMFEFFGGTTEVIVPDNLRSGITKADFYDPVLNPTYQRLAEHYEIAVLPARKRKPRDKAKVENGVLIVERSILARLRNRTFYSLDEVNVAIAELLAELNQRPFQKLPGSRWSAFEQLDRPKLRPLPQCAFEMAEWKRAGVQPDYHVAVNGSYYSVPHRLVRQAVEVRLTEYVVEILHDGQRVACHRRSESPGSVSTLLEHMPAHHREVAGWSPEIVRRRAQLIGPSTSAFVECLLQSEAHPDVNLRSSLGVLGQARKHGNERLELACSKAVETNASSLGFIKQMLKSGLEGSPRPAAAQVIDHENLRGEEHFREVAKAC